MAKNTSKNSGGGKNDAKSSAKASKQPLYATQEYRDAKANPLASNRSAMLDEEKTKLIAKAEAQRIRDIVNSAPKEQKFSPYVEALRRKNPGQAFSYQDNKTGKWIKVPALDPKQSMAAQEAKIAFNADGTPANVITENLLKKATFVDGKGYGAQAAALVRAGYVPPTGTTPVTPTPVPTPVAPVPTPVDPAPVATAPVPTVPTTFVSDPVSDAYPTYGKMAASARAPSFTPAGNGANPYQKAGVTGFVAPKAATSFAPAQPKSGNKQSLNGLGAQADFGRSFGDSYSKNGNRKDGLF